MLKLKKIIEEEIKRMVEAAMDDFSFEELSSLSSYKKRI